LWHHATVEGVEGDEMVLPLTGDGDKSDDDDEYRDNFDEEDTQDFVPEQLLDRISG